MCTGKQISIALLIQALTKSFGSNISLREREIRGEYPIERNFAIIYHLHSNAILVWNSSTLNMFNENKAVEGDENGNCTNLSHFKNESDHNT